MEVTFKYAVFYPCSRILRGISKISKRCVGVDAHIDPANGTDFTGISGESVGAQWGDVGIAPYAKFKDYAKFETLHQKQAHSVKAEAYAVKRTAARTAGLPSGFLMAMRTVSPSCF